MVFLLYLAACRSERQLDWEWRGTKLTAGGYDEIKTDLLLLEIYWLYSWEQM